MSDVVRVRFAPSPTGYLHIGGARTAIFNWLYARKMKGSFILRIEDTDQERSTDESTRAILDSMSWLGLDWDEGPFFQAQRMDIYNEHVEKLIKEGSAYYCTCPQDELEEKRKKALAEGRKPRYDGKCRGTFSRPESSAAVRFMSRDVGSTVVNDLIKGRVIVENSELDDLIIRRSDGWPTYNFCVVIDDATMNITCVIRGDDHLNNTPRQIQIYEALGYPTPAFAHVPMILGSDKTRLSKRHGATSVMAYKDMGYLPEALFNYLVRLGWSSGDQEVFSKTELIDKFSLEHVGRSPGVFNPEKLLWLNAHYIRSSEDPVLGAALSEFLQNKGYNTKKGPEIFAVVHTLKERSKTLLEMSDSAEFYYKDTIEFDEKAVDKFLNDATVVMLTHLINLLKPLDDMSFRHEGIEKVFTELTVLMGVKLKDIAQPVRVAITGNSVSPGIFEVMEVLGKEVSLKRLQMAIDMINQPVSA